MTFKNRSRRGSFIAFSVLGLMLVTASLAWACTPQQQITHITPMAHRPGGEVKVTGDKMTAGQPVVISWNTVDGPKLATASADANGAFSTSFTVPQTEPGVYFILVTTNDDQSALARTSFEVTASSAPAEQASSSSAPSTLNVSPDLWSGFSAQGSGLSEAAAQDPGSSSASGLGLGVALAGAGSMFALCALLASRRRQKAEG